MNNKNKISVIVQTKYLEQESNPQKQRFVFAYHITIKNLGDNTCQLIDRHWHITSEDNTTEEVIGQGVVGQQPFIAPNEQYEYTSGAILTTPTGSMYGAYGMLNDDHERFEVSIPEFGLFGPRTLH